MVKHPRERSLTALVVLEAIALFVVAPLAAKGVAPFAVDIAIMAAVLAVVWRSRAAVAAVIVAAAVELLATALRIARPSERTEALRTTARR